MDSAMYTWYIDEPSLFVKINHISFSLWYLCFASTFDLEF